MKTFMSEGKTSCGLKYLFRNISEEIMADDSYLIESQIPTSGKFQNIQHKKHEHDTEAHSNQVQFMTAPVARRHACIFRETKYSENTCLHANSASQSQHRSSTFEDVQEKQNTLSPRENVRSESNRKLLSEVLSSKESIIKSIKSIEQELLRKNYKRVKSRNIKYVMSHKSRK